MSFLYFWINQSFKKLSKLPHKYTVDHRDLLYLLYLECRREHMQMTGKFMNKLQPVRGPTSADLLRLCPGVTVYFFCALCHLTQLWFSPRSIIQKDWDLREPTCRTTLEMLTLHDVKRVNKPRHMKHNAMNVQILYHFIHLLSYKNTIFTLQFKGVERETRLCILQCFIQSRNVVITSALDK